MTSSQTRSIALFVPAVSPLMKPRKQTGISSDQSAVHSEAAQIGCSAAAACGTDQGADGDRKSMMAAAEYNRT